MVVISDPSTRPSQTVADQSKLLADQVVEATRQIVDSYQTSYVAILEAGFQATNRWFELSRVMLDQAETASRESKVTFENLVVQNRARQQALVSIARNNGQTVQDAWLGAYKNGVKA